VKTAVSSTHKASVIAVFLSMEVGFKRLEERG
jgi:hypothetical protein